MTRSRSRLRSAILLLSTASLLGGCGPNENPNSTRPSADATAGSPVPAASSGEFQPMAWPLPGGGAPCDQGQPPDAEHGAYLGTLQRVKAIDALTVEFRLCVPDIALPTRLAFPAFAINDAAWLQSHIDPAATDPPAILRDVNGTGPYRLESFNMGSDVTLVRNDGYWGAAARNERVIIRWRDDAGGRLNELHDGSVDVADDLATSDAEAIAADVALQAVPRPGLNILYVGFTNTFAPFDNLRVRKAIALGIDRERLVRELYPAGSEVASHLGPCAIPDGCAGAPWYEFDPTAARQMLADAGFGDGFRTTIQYRTAPRPYLPDPTAVATELQSQLLANLNITADLQVMPDDTFLSTVDTGQADGIHLLGRTMNVPETSNLLGPHFGVSASREFGNPIDGLADLLATGATTLDPAARSAIYAEANDLIRTNVPLIPIVHAGSLSAYRWDVGGATGSPVRLERLSSMTPGDRSQLVWLASEPADGLYCADETSRTAELACAQLTEGLYGFVEGGAGVVPVLAEGCEPNAELTVWRCQLRPDVTFHDGSRLDANDVVLSFAVQWDADHPLHRGREGAFQPFRDVFGGLLNPPR